MTHSIGSERSSWTLYSWALMGLFIFFQLMQWPLTPRFLDVYYHLSVMKGFAEAGGYVTHAYWEYAPGGRPHLYPPLLHILMLLVYKLGVPAIEVGRLVDMISYPMLLIVFWRLARRFHGERAAFLALVLFASSYSALLASVTLSAFNLAAILLLLGIERLESRRRIASAICLGLSFYAHTLVGWVFVLYVLLRSFPARRFRDAGAVIFGGLILASPFLAYQISNRSAFAFVDVYENNLLEWDLGLYTLGAAALWSYRHLKARHDLAVPLALWAAMIPLLLTHPVRFLYGHGLLGLSWIGALYLDTLVEKLSRSSVRRAGSCLVGACLFFTTLAPIVRWNADTKEGSVVWADRALIRYLWPDPYANFRSNGFTIFFPEHYEEIVRIIRENSQKGDILWTDFSYTAGILAILSDRVTSCAMLAEVRPSQRSNHLTDAQLVIWFKDRDAKPQAEMLRSAERHGFRLIQETEMAFIYQNPVATVQQKVPAPLMPIWALLLLTASAFTAIFWPARKTL